MSFKNSVTLIILLSPFWAIAQRSNLLQRGETAFKQQNFVSAISFFEEAIEYQSQFSTKELANAFYWRGLSYLELSKKEASASEYPNALIQAFQDLEKVTNMPIKGKISQTAETTLQSLPELLLGKAFQLLEQSQRKDIRPGLRQSKSRLAINHARLAQKLDPDNYLIHAIEGQARLIQRDSAGAFEDLEQSIQAFETNPPNQPDLKQSKVYHLLAMLQQFYFSDSEAAITLVGRGFRSLEQEKNRSGQLSDEQFSNFQKSQKELQEFELEIYQRDPLLLNSTLQSFEKTIERNPSDYGQRLAYAKLLGKKDLDASIQQYQQAIAISEQNFEAQHALGLIFFQRGKALYQQAEESLKPSLIESLTAQYKAQFSTALPYLENAYIQDNADLTIIAALVEVCKEINEKEKYKNYRDAQRRARGY